MAEQVLVETGEARRSRSASRRTSATSAGRSGLESVKAMRPFDETENEPPE